jgi:hypothetical protein
MSAKREITRADIMDMSAYAEIRKARRQEITQAKRDRRLAVGPFATFYFENYDTMWMQIHEMLYIERGGEEQIQGELDAYNPLIPNGRNLVCTLMFEIADEQARARELARLGGIEDTVKLELGDHAIAARPLADGVERTTDDGKTSAVHFLRFDFTADDIARFRDPAIRTLLSIGHSNYGHMAVIPENVRNALAADLD